MLNKMWKNLENLFFFKDETWGYIGFVISLTSICLEVFGVLDYLDKVTAIEEISLKTVSFEKYNKLKQLYFDICIEKDQLKKSNDKFVIQGIEILNVINDKDKKINVLMFEKDNLNKLLDQKDIHIKTLNSKLVDLKKQNEEFKIEIANLRKQNEQYKIEIDNFRKQD